MRKLLYLLILALWCNVLVASESKDSVRLSFTNESVMDVLSYLSDECGYIVMMESPIDGNITCTSSVLTPAATVLWLDSQLLPMGYTALLSGNTLTLFSSREAALHAVPVIIGNDPELVPRTSEFVTQIIPVRFIEAGSLLADLSSFISPSAKVTANADGNTLIVTDTCSSIHHFMELVRAVDVAARRESQLGVFQLKHASPLDVATVLRSVYPSGGTSAPSGETVDVLASDLGEQAVTSVHKVADVLVVADARLQAVLVSAPDYLMPSMSSLIASLDVASVRDQNVYTYKLVNADPEQVAQVLQGIFSAGGATGSSSALMQRAQSAANTGATISTTLTAASPSSTQAN